MLDLGTLNPEQLEAVLTTDGPLLVLAGAGSGKTRVITYRLAYLIRQGVSPEQILAVTFTNKAAREMSERAKKLVGRNLDGATLCTFHSLGARILRQFPDRVGLRPGFTISDAGDQIGTFRRILRELNVYERSFDVKRVMAMVSLAKNAGLDAAAFREQEGTIPGESLFDGADEHDYSLAAIEAFDRYQGVLRSQNVVDFDDLLLLTQRLIETDREVREALQNRWHHLMIDEYQDTNGSQLSLMRLIAGERKNLCVVGDDDQSIYGWRGADIRNILSFEKQFGGAKVVKLETNYRSTGSILGLANTIIAQNRSRHDKTLRAYAGEGEPVHILAVEDEEREAETVASKIFELTAAGTKKKEIAVLFRSNVQARPIEIALRGMHIPYRVSGGMDIFDKKEIKDVFAYLRVLQNPEDDQSLRRIINFPPRGIGETSIDRVDSWAQAEGLSLWKGLERAYEVEGLAQKAQDAIAQLVSQVSAHRTLLSRQRPSTVVGRLMEVIGLEQVLFDSSDNLEAAHRRVDNVREIVREIERYEERTYAGKKRGRPAAGELQALAEPETKPTLAGFIAELALGNREESAASEGGEDEVVLSTIHASKGLEWDHVFLVGAEEELLPHKRTVAGDGEIEEERRLAYVAVTRARKQLTISWARQRTRYGKLHPRTRSRFLEKLPDTGIELHEDEIKIERTEEEKDRIAQSYMEQIRAKLGL